jgi:cvfA/B/C family virulence factor
MAKYQILYWKDIPAQVKAFDGARAVSRQLPERFQLEIDRLAMELGLAGGDEYLNQWHWTAKFDRPGTAAEVLESISQELISEWDPKILGKQSDDS